MKDFEQLSHTADIKIRVYGSTKEELFVNALAGMFQTIVPHADGCTQKDGRLVCPILPAKRTVQEQGPDAHALLVNFLSEALYLSDVHNEAYLDADIEHLSNTSICATLKGVPVTGFDVVEIKAVTYHDLFIEHTNNEWVAEIVFDI